MTTVYSYQQIEEHIKKLGPLRLKDGVGNEVAHTIFNDSPERVIGQYLTLINRGSYRRVNQKGVVEGTWCRTTITDIYRIVINWFPDYDIEGVYKEVYKLLDLNKIHSFVCWDIFRRVYRGISSSCQFSAYPPIVDSLVSDYKKIETDEFGVETEKFLTNPNVIKIGQPNVDVQHANLLVLHDYLPATP